MAELADPRLSRVVLIGNARYAHADLADVPAVNRNVTGLRAVFTDPELWGVPGDRCVELLDEADGAVVARTVREAAAEVHPDGLLVVYYAGHGLIDAFDGSLVLALADTDPAAPYEAGLRYELLRRAIAGSPARRRVVILDCCYAGRATAELAGEAAGTVTVADRAEIDQTCLLVSAPRNRTAQAPPGEPYTAFTGELLRVLRGGLPDHPAVLDVRTVWQEVRRALAARGFEVPDIRAANAGDGVPLVRNAARGQRDFVGRVLVASAAVTDRDLHQAVVLVLRHERGRGAVGVRINKPVWRVPADFPEGWRRLLKEPAMVFDGGPLNTTEGYIAAALLWPGRDAPVRFQRVRDRLGVIALSTDPAPLPTLLSCVRLFSGYLGWGPDQLEADIDEGVLLRTDAPATIAVQSERPEELWTSLHSRGT